MIRRWSLDYYYSVMNDGALMPHHANSLPCVRICAKASTFTSYALLNRFLSISHTSTPHAFVHSTFDLALASKALRSVKRLGCYGKQDIDEPLDLASQWYIPKLLNPFCSKLTSKPKWVKAMWLHVTTSPPCRPCSTACKDSLRILTTNNYATLDLREVKSDIAFYAPEHSMS